MIFTYKRSAVGNESSGGDAVLLAHYTKSGRNIWAYLHNDADGTTVHQ